MNTLVFRLTGLAAVCGLLLGLANLATSAQIKANRQAFAERQLLEVTGHKGKIRKIDDERYLLLDAGQPRGFVFGVETNQGYNGRISLWLGVEINASNPSKASILGVRVRSHQETPGLGDRIELAVSDWILAFNGHQSANGTHWDVRKFGG
ncbi:MAG: hypothetical protein WD994_02490, partial [Pseudomonadales bacterium]